VAAKGGRAKWIISATSIPADKVELARHNS